MLVELLVWFGQFIYFLAAIFLAFYLPGRFFLQKLQLTVFQKAVLALVLGMVLWAWQGFIFGYLQMRWLSYLYLLFFFIIWVKHQRKPKITFSLPRLDFIIVFLIAVGSFIQLTATWLVGTMRGTSLYFCCGNAGDNTLYASITNEIVKRFPPFEPAMFGVLLQNYHYWGNLVIAELIRVFNLPLFPTSFQFFMLFLVILLGLSAFVFAEILGLPKLFSRWFLFFLYFGADAIFLLLTFLGKHNIFSMSSLEDGAKFLSNPSRAFAVVALFLGLSLFILWIRKKQLRIGILMAVVFASLISFKVYIGLFVLSGLGALGVYFLITKQYKFVLPLLLTLFLSIIIYLPVNKDAGGLYFTGFWRFENFISQPALGLVHLDMARQIFAASHNWKVIFFEVLFAVVYIFAIFGTKLFGLIQTKKSLSLLPKELHIVLITGTLASLAAGLFFEQKSGGSNTFNFLVSVFIISSLYAALTCFHFSKRLPKKAAIIIAVIIIIVTSPRVIHAGWQNLYDMHRGEGYTIFKPELEGLIYLKEKTPESSLILIDNRWFLQDRHSPYIGVIADRSVFLSGINNELQAHGINYKDREDAAKLIISYNDPILIAQALLDNKIDYVLFGAQTTMGSSKSASFLDVVYKNEAVRIEKVSSSKIKNYLQYRKTHPNEEIF